MNNPDEVTVSIAFGTAGGIGALHRRNTAASAVRFAVAAALGMPLLALPAFSQSASSVQWYAYVRGSDTLATESLMETRESVAGSLAFPGQPVIEWEQSPGRTPNGPPSPLVINVRGALAAQGSPPLQKFTFSTRGDSVTIVTEAGGGSSTQVVASARNATFLIGQSVLHGAIISRILSNAGFSTVPLFLTNGAQTISGTVSRSGSGSADTTSLSLAGIAIRAIWKDGKLIEAAVPAQGIRVVPITSKRNEELATPKPIDYSAPANAPYTAEQVTIPTTRGYSLGATLTLPRGSGERVPVAVTISGSGPQERDSRISIVKGYAPFRDIADTLGRRGIAVLRYDDRGVGASGGEDSRNRATSADFADDVQSVVAWLSTRSDIDPSRIALIGHSEGGLIAPIAAARDSSIHAVVLMAGPALNGRKILVYQNEIAIRGAQGITEAQRDSIRRSVPTSLDSLEKSNPWYGFFMRVNPLDTLKRVAQPVLILQGDTDQQVTPDQADSIAATLRVSGNRQVTLKHFSETNHLFLKDKSGAASGYPGLTDTRVRPEVLGTIADWLTRVMKGA